ncbi:MAG: glycosyltransferase family 4 protein [Calditrichia bacterium]
MAKALQARGHEIRMAGRPDSKFLKTFEQAGFEGIALSMKGRSFFSNVRKLRHYVKTQRPDIVIAERNKDIRLAGPALKLTPEIPLIARTGLPSIKNVWRYRLIYPKLLDGIVVPTEAIKARYRTYGWINPDIIEVIQDGIEPVNNGEIDGAAVKAEIKIPADKKVVGIFSSLNKKKQHNIFLETAARILQNNPEVVFLVVGDGPERENIQKYAYELGIMDQLYMTGFQEDTQPLYAICDVVLLTSLEEGLPHTTMEAMMMEKPVVAFNVGALSELIETGKSGILVPPNDIFLLTQNTEELLMDPDYAARIGREARKRIEDNFKMETMLTRFETYLEQKISEKRGKENVT